ncbi:DinB family protein [Deinococcus cellulosilyticus]|uniref:Damage-inducible protein DinB n=1 Tax=Deinococcus cellulosilyticus (strain DSM 18568 / NBRC 106333 / KACC 11606 / 5516J-15) TaxID=1223518 RepID=A0A511N792_DEIC1|nr:DinB family protein [Deinococcus cellulosilyticus]GEM48357.1 damage-inducible protein DinB [Deinococcus cellulosilyticus NBRC 106333 = KACC 11606]
MQPEMFYTYLTKARRLLWDTLRTLSDEELSRPVLPSDGARCIKDLVHHIAIVEDGWFRLDLLGEPMVYAAFGAEPRSADEYWHHETETLEKLLSYWEAVEKDTLKRWPDIMAVAQSGRRIKAFDDRAETLSAEEVLWHVMQHEVRHTAHIVQLVRLIGHTPPQLDYVFLMTR